MKERTGNRQLRIFVSSTFQDMVEERNVLVEKVFPMVAAYCHKKQVEFTGVDLRWGITEEESERGETVDVCMSEIDRSRPLFMGMIGERYGWIPEGNPVSVTEQEILYGALEAPEDTEAFFYMRDADLTRQLCGSFEPDARLEDLRARIRAGRYPVLDGYRDLDSFGQRVYEDLLGAVDRLVIQTEEPDSVQEVRRDQFFLADRYAWAFVNRPAEEEKLRALADQGGLTILTGETGTGKTAMLARWALEKEASGEGYTFLFFAGNTADRGWEQLARQLVAELCARFRLDLEVPDDKEGLRRAVCQVLGMAAREDRIRLVLDQLDTLALDDAYGLSWLPEYLPDGVSVVAALSEGEVLTRLRRRPHREMRLTNLTPDETVRVAESFLARYSKRLSRGQLAMLGASERANNPLYLITLLNEIRQTGRHEDLTDLLSAYLACADFPELFEKVLCRVDRDYDGEGTLLPRRFFLLLEASGGGLTEGELLPLLGGVPQARFAPLRLALEMFTAVSGGAVHIAVPAFRQAVLDHYAPEESELMDWRHKIAEWFYENPDTPRRFMVLPRLLRETGQSERLFEILSGPACFDALWRHNKYEIREYWAELEAGGESAAEGYRSLLEDPSQHDGVLLTHMAEFFAEKGEPERAQKLLEWLVSENVPVEKGQRGTAFGLLGNLYQREGRQAKAEECYRSKYDLAGAAGDAYEQERALGNLGLLSLARRDLAAAGEAFREVLDLAVSLNQRDAQQVALGNLGNIAFSLKDLDRAEDLFKKQKVISQDSGNISGILNACGALGVVYMTQGRFEEAEREFAAQEEQSRRLGAADALSNALGNLAALAQRRGEIDRAKALLLEKLDICKKSGQAQGEQNALGNLASLAAGQGRLQEALELARDRANLTKKIRAFRQYAEALRQLSGIEQALGLDREAKTHMMQAAALVKQHGFTI